MIFFFWKICIDFTWNFVHLKAHKKNYIRNYWSLMPKLLCILSAETWIQMDWLQPNDSERFNGILFCSYCHLCNSYRRKEVLLFITCKTYQEYRVPIQATEKFAGEKKRTEKFKNTEKTRRYSSFIKVEIYAIEQQQTHTCYISPFFYFRSPAATKRKEPWASFRHN